MKEIELKTLQFQYALMKLSVLIRKEIIDAVIIAFNQFANWRTDIIGLKKDIPLFSFLIDAYLTDAELDPCYLRLGSESEIYNFLDAANESEKDGNFYLQIFENSVKIGDYEINGFMFGRLKTLIDAITPTEICDYALDFTLFFEAVYHFDFQEAAYYFAINQDGIKTNGITNGNISVMLPPALDTTFILNPGAIIELLDTAASQMDVMQNTIFTIIQFCHCGGGNIDVALRLYCQNVYNFNPSLLERIKKNIKAADEIGLRSNLLKLV